MKIGRKLMISFTVICLFLLISAAITVIYTLKINNQLSKITEEVNPSENDVQDMISILWRSNYIVQRYSTENDREMMEALDFEFRHINDLYKEKENSVLSLVENNAVENRVGHAGNKQEIFYKLALKLMNKKKQDITIGILDDGESFYVQYSITKQLEKDIVGAIESLDEALDEISKITLMANKKSDQAVRNAIIMIFLTAILSLVTAALIWSMLTKSITTPIKSLSKATSKLSKGNFDVEVKIEDSDDEISELATTFNQMVSSIRAIIEESPRFKRFIKIKGKKEAITKKYIVEEGTGYLIKDPTSSEAYEMLIEKINEKYSPLVATRENPGVAMDRFGIQKKDIIWLSDEKQKGIKSTSNLNLIQKNILDFVTKNEKTIVLLDRSDYLTNKYGFENFLRFVTNVNDKIMAGNSIFMLPIDPEIFTNKQLSLLEKELHKPPQQSVSLSLSEELKKILKFISDRQAINKPATYKDVGQEFVITAPTTQKKVEELNALGLITISKMGRKKILEPTRDGERVLANN
tara:strand:+ start:1899 stop:3470 length:1572 start_codon:yes stop_codon:yes gene_type:complete